MLMNHYLYPKRYLLNISRPNVYVFEYENQILNQFSLYNILNIVIYLLTFLLMFLVFISFSPEFKYNFSIYNKLLSALILYFLLKNLFSFLMYFFIKNYKVLSKLRFIHSTFNVYLSFNVYILSFLFFYLPVKNNIYIYVIASISILWAISIWFSIYKNFHKHTELKSYQLFLYLCLTEILPLIVLIKWISLQII